MKKVKETKASLKMHIEDVTSKLNDIHITPKEKKVAEACLRMYKNRLAKKK